MVTEKLIEELKKFSESLDEFQELLESNGVWHECSYDSDDGSLYCVQVPVSVSSVTVGDDGMVQDSSIFFKDDFVQE